MKSIYTIFVFFFLTMLVFTGLNIVGGEVGGRTGTYLDEESLSYIDTLNSRITGTGDDDYGNYNSTTFSTANDFQAENQDAFSLQFLMGTSAGRTNSLQLDSFKKTPNLFFFAFGMEGSEWDKYRTLLNWFLGILFAMLAFVLIFGPGKIFPSGGES